MMQSGGFSEFSPFAHFDEGITLVGGLSDNPCCVGAIRKEDLICTDEKINDRFSSIVQSIVDGMKESGAV